MRRQVTISGIFRLWITAVQVAIVETVFDQGNDMQTVLTHETTIRVGLFLGLLGLMALWEIAAPQRRLELPRVLRWSNNLALVFVDTAILRLVLPTLAVGVAIIAHDRGWGLFNLLGWPLWVKGLLAILVLDLAIYGQHIVFHKVPVLWRMHRMHHSDPDFDVTTGVRFHPLEILLSMLIKMALVAALGADPAAVILFELILSAGALFSHANIRLPQRLDRALRLVVVTPDMHRIHHSEVRRETDSNYGFSVTWWDRLFGTYRVAAKAGQQGIRFGIGAFGSRREQWLDQLFVQPLRDPDDDSKAPRP